MTVAVKSTSVVGLSISSQVKKFILTNANAMAVRKDVSTEEGADAMAQAICFAISKALASPSVAASFALGVGPTNAGQLIYTALKAATIEPTIL